MSCLGGNSVVSLWFGCSGGQPGVLLELGTVALTLQADSLQQVENEGEPRYRQFLGLIYSLESEMKYFCFLPVRF